MDVLPLPKLQSAVHPMRRHLGGLIETVGTHRFGPSLMAASREAVKCEHVTAFAMPAAKPPRVLLADSVGSVPIARVASAKYAAQFWTHDPINRLSAREVNGEGVAVRVCADEIEDNAYRRDCYVLNGLQERFSIQRERAGETLRVNFYRSRTAGRFAACEMQSVVESADCLISLLAKHDAMTAPTESGSTTELFARRLRVLAPTLSQRETDVCVAIADGMSSEAIALKLGISLNTVLTYRKRAYARLGISSQNELLKMVLV